MSDVQTLDEPGAVVRSMVIARPADELYRLLADPRRHREIDGGGSVGTVIEAPEEVRPGDTFTIRMRQFGVPYRITSRVTRAVPAEIVEWRHPQGHHWRWELADIGDGRTRVTETFDYRGNRARGMLRLFGIPRSNGVEMEKSLRNLAALVDSP